MTAKPITSFSGEYRFLSNFWLSPVSWGDRLTPPTIFCCVEVPYQAAKTLEPAERTTMLSVTKPSQAKRWGRTLTLRPDWDKVKVDIMLDLVSSKFVQSLELQDLLLATGERELIEGNHWGALFWGKASRDDPKEGIKAGEGCNVLGKILMHVRSCLRDGKNPWFPSPEWFEQLVHDQPKAA